MISFSPLIFVVSVVAASVNRFSLDNDKSPFAVVYPHHNRHDGKNGYLINGFNPFLNRFSSDYGYLAPPFGYHSYNGFPINNGYHGYDEFPINNGYQGYDEFPFNNGYPIYNGHLLNEGCFNQKHESDDYLPVGIHFPEHFLGRHLLCLKYSWGQIKVND
ncbi:hypothetical protein ABEB36_006694 [Hypothenemus hampei]|uniref:Uncharacterized protein n=1 Tax=Hypothenemus hampei TaxID=57062 RepID=A0ABD1ERG1_HYPHA